MTWQSLTRESQAETQSVIEELLGMTEATFSQSVFSAQGSVRFADANITPAARKQVLTEALGLDLWQKLCSVVAEDRRQSERDLEIAEAARGSFPTDDDVAEAEAALARDQTAADDLEQQIAALERTLEEHRRSLDAAREAAAERRSAEAHRDVAKAEFARLHELAGEGAKARAAADDLLQQIATHAELATTVAEWETRLDAANTAALAVKERQDLLDQARERTASAGGMQLKATQVAAQITETEAALLATCDRCGQRVDAAAKETLLNSLRADVSTLEAEHERLRLDAEALVARADGIDVQQDELTVDQLRARLQEAREAEQALARLEARYEAFGVVLARVGQDSFTEAYEAARDALVAAEQSVRDMPEPATIGPTLEITTAESSLRLARDQLTLIAASRGAGEEKLRFLREAVAAAGEHHDRIAALQTRVSELRMMERMYGRDGIPALLLESVAVQQIEAEAHRVLEALGTNLRVELRTQRALKTADRQRETLDVVVVEPNGERSYASFSGGECTRIDLALQIGLARLIASRKGADVRVLCLDELEYLDNEGLRRLPDLLRGLAEFDSVIVISHDEALLDGFDQSVLVVKDGDRSRIAA